MFTDNHYHRFFKRHTEWLYAISDFIFFTYYLGLLWLKLHAEWFDVVPQIDYFISIVIINYLFGITTITTIVVARVF